MTDFTLTVQWLLSNLESMMDYVLNDFGDEESKETAMATFNAISSMQ